MNYSMQEYANDVVATIQEACDEAEVAASRHRHRVGTRHGGAPLGAGLRRARGERDRAHGSAGPDSARRPDDPKRAARPLAEIGFARRFEARERPGVLSRRGPAAQGGGFHAVLARLSRPAKDRARAERLFSRAAASRSCGSCASSTTFPRISRTSRRSLADTYYGNFSVFQSAPDHWAVKQLFPVMPIHRLDESPPGAACSRTSPATATARSTSSSTRAT